VNVARRLPRTAAGADDAATSKAAPESPLDPIFWTHHCMIDRCWVEWNITRNHANTSASDKLDVDVVLVPFEGRTPKTRSLPIGGLRLEVVRDTVTPGG
jgi:hypothetical protein